MVVGEWTHSTALFAISSAPSRPLPMNVAAGLWYTLAREETSPRSSSRIAGETVVWGRLMGGRTDRTTD